MFKIKILYEYIKNFISLNKVLFILILSIFSIIYLLFIVDSKETNTYKILSEFEHDNIKYISSVRINDLLESLNDVSQHKLNDNYKIKMIDDNLYEIIETTTKFSLLIGLLIISSIILLIILFDIDSIDLPDMISIKYKLVNRIDDINCMYIIYNNKVIYVKYKDNDSAYCNLSYNDDTLIMNNISRYDENSNIFQDFEGTKIEIRNKKINSIILGK